MIALDNGDKIRGDAAAANEVDYLIFGFVGTVATQIADGQLPAAIGDLYTAGADGIGISSIVLVNTGAVARAVNLYLTPNAGVARRLIPEDYPLPAGYSLHTDGKEVKMFPEAERGLYSDYIHIRDEKASGTNGGGFTQGAWRTRDLNVELDDTGGDAALAANQITLEAGTYRVNISCPAYHVSAHKTRLYNITDGVTILVGTSEYDASVEVVSQSFVVGRFTLAAQKVLEVQHRCMVTQAVNGLGAACTYGEVEVYTEVELWKEL